MLGKLIKHEFRATGRIMLPGSAGVLILSVMGNLAFRTVVATSSTLLEIISGFVALLFVLSIVALCLSAFVIMISRFYKNLMGDEGYMMHTLPVSVHGIVWSKLLVSLVWFIYTTLVLILSMVIVTFRLDAFMRFVDEFRYQLQLFLTYYDIDINFVLIILEALIMAFVGGATSCLMLYASISVGCGFAKHKVLLSVAFFFLFSFVVQIISSFISLGFADNAVFYNIPDAIQLYHSVSWTAIGIFAAYGTAYYFITTHSLKKRLNLQ